MEFSIKKKKKIRNYRFLSKKNWGKTEIAWMQRVQHVDSTNEHIYAYIIRVTSIEQIKRDTQMCVQSVFSATRPHKYLHSYVYAVVCWAPSQPQATHTTHVSHQHRMTHTCIVHAFLHRDRYRCWPPLLREMHTFMYFNSNKNMRSTCFGILTHRAPHSTRICASETNTDSTQIEVPLLSERHIFAAYFDFVMHNKSISLTRASKPHFQHFEWGVCCSIKIKIMKSYMISVVSGNNYDWIIPVYGPRFFFLNFLQQK